MAPAARSRFDRFRRREQGCQLRREDGRERAHRIALPRPRPQLHRQHTDTSTDAQRRHYYRFRASGTIDDALFAGAERRSHRIRIVTVDFRKASDDRVGIAARERRTQRRGACIPLPDDHPDGIEQARGFAEQGRHLSTIDGARKSRADVGDRGDADLTGIHRSWWFRRRGVRRKRLADLFAGVQFSERSSVSLLCFGQRVRDRRFEEFRDDFDSKGGFDRFFEAQARSAGESRRRGNRKLRRRAGKCRADEPAELLDRIAPRCLARGGFRGFHLRGPRGELGMERQEFADERFGFKTYGSRVITEIRTSKESFGPGRQVVALERLEQRELDLRVGRYRRERDLSLFALLAKTGTERCIHGTPRGPGAARGLSDRWGDCRCTWGTAPHNIEPAMLPRAV